MPAHNLHHTLQEFRTVSGKTYRYYSLPALETAGIGVISRLPLSIRIVLESVLRNVDHQKITPEHVKQLANWQPRAERLEEIPFVVARVVLQDFTGIPLLADLAAMRNVAADMGKDPKLIEPLVPVDLVVDHSVQIDFYGTEDALQKNMELEFSRNRERYQFMKWGMQAFDTFRVVPPGFGIVHQVNLEYLFPGIQYRHGIAFPDTLVGTDSHTTMINAVGVVGWGVGGIEAEAGMLGQPVYFLTPDVVGVNLTGQLREGVTATDLVLTITEMLRKAKVVGMFVEFIGDGAASLSLTDRATIANMAPEYGATLGFFPVDETTVAYLKNTGRSQEAIEAFEAYFRAQQMFGTPHAGQIDYTRQLTLDLGSVIPSLAGPKRPQDRIALSDMKKTFNRLFSQPIAENGFNKKAEELAQRYLTNCALPGIATTTGTTDYEGRIVRGEADMIANRPTTDQLQALDTGALAECNPDIDIGHGDVLIAAITSCTNTSNPAVLLAAGLLAKKAVQKGLRVHPRVKTSFGPGSRVVPEYLKAAGLQTYLDQLGFSVAAFGCTTCIGNAGDLAPEINEAIVDNDVIAAAVLSGNRNFEARIHPNIRANFLASPPLVVAFAIAGKVNIDLENEPVGIGSHGPVYLRDIWPNSAEIAAVMKYATAPEIFREKYSDFTKDNLLWQGVKSTAGEVYSWPLSTYIARPPFFERFSLQPPAISEIRGAKALLILGDSITTDHISPAGSFKATTPAGVYLTSHGVTPVDFNTYGSRRGHHDIMIRGTFANVRIKNLMLPPKPDGSAVEGGFTLIEGRQTTVYDAAMQYLQSGTPTVVFAGEEYGTGSSRDWAAKGTQLLGVKAVIARSFERIHRSNLVGMGVLPLQFMGEDSVSSLHLKGDEIFDIQGSAGPMKPKQLLTLVITHKDGNKTEIQVLSRIDTAIEVDYYQHGGILPFVLRQILNKN